MRMVFRLLLPVALLAAAATTITASDRTVTVIARATFDERTSLAVSTGVLEFVVAPGATSATAILEFTAGVRTLPGREVIVVAEQVPQFDAVLRFSGEGTGLPGGELTAAEPSIVARYYGGGQRHGRLVFTLENVAPGLYTVPVRLSVTVL